MRALRQLSRRGSGLATAIPILMILTCGTDAAERRLCLVELSLLGTGGALQCEQPAQQVVVDTSCKAFAPIRYSRKDTPESVRQIREHNAAFDALCKRKK